MNTKDRLKKIANHGNRMYKGHEIERPEALSKVSYQNALDFFTSQGIKSSENTDKIEFYSAGIQKSLKALQ